MSHPMPPVLSRGRIFATTLKTAALVAAMSYLAANWLSGSGLDQHSLHRLASSASKGVADPLTTGSIAARADTTRLDPCIARPRS